jgi:hypothetical protein
VVGSGSAGGGVDSGGGCVTPLGGSLVGAFSLIGLRDDDDSVGVLIIAKRNLPHEVGVSTLWQIRWFDTANCHRVVLFRV